MRVFGKTICETIGVLFKGRNQGRGNQLSSSDGIRRNDKVKKSKRPITKIILHCSATPPNMDIGVKEIRRWHLERGFKDIGYHLVGRRKDGIEIGRDIDMDGAHVRGHNKNTIGICMVGGVDKNMKPEDNFTDKQWRDIRFTLKWLKADYPNATIHGHNEFAAKACPSFDVQYELQHGRLKDV